MQGQLEGDLGTRQLWCLGALHIIVLERHDPEHCCASCKPGPGATGRVQPGLEPCRQHFVRETCRQGQGAVGVGVGRLPTASRTGSCVALCAATAALYAAVDVSRYFSTETLYHIIRPTLLIMQIRQQQTSAIKPEGVLISTFPTPSRHCSKDK